ncbi:hypothetical protein LOK49_LG06G02581 [Camellia lanceoleosa]|uniref:Uncharacterized protein n=1 Tax=Camellia lanceoleosa TaxID=1840588 RepID=A0ACC0HAD7_9ERIC|nr:hypothetical protein LOK49_LG06G02581 [Camellia lanceoleosa]
MFNALDVNGDGSLDLKEMMALYYVIKSGRPFCGGCVKRTMAMAARKPPPAPEEPKKKSGLLRLFESQTMRKVFGAAAVASTEVAVATGAAVVDPDNCSIL